MGSIIANGFGDGLASLSERAGEALSGGGLLLPLGALLAMRLFAGSATRMLFGPLGLLALGLFFLAREHSLAGLVSSEVGKAVDQIAPESSFSGFPIGGTLLIVLFLLLGPRILPMRALIPVGLITFLLLPYKDRLLAALSAAHGITTLHLVIAAVGGILLGRFGRGNSFTYKVRQLVPLQHLLFEWRPILKQLAVAGAGAFTVMFVAQPRWLDSLLPGWRITFGGIFLFGAIFALGATLPVKYRPWLVPAYWGVISIVLAGQLILGGTSGQMMSRAF